MMKRGISSAVSNTNIRPGCSAPQSQATLYALKFSGNLRLNASATPRPMTPTQLTLLTKASLSAANRSPVTYLIIARAPYLIVGAYFYTEAG